MFSEYLYVVKVYDEDKTHEYEYGNLRNAVEHYIEELTKRNGVTLFRIKDGILERYHDRTNTWG